MSLPLATASFGKFDCAIGNMGSDENRWKDSKWRSYRYIFYQTRTHSITMNQHNSVSHTFSVRTRRRIDSSCIIAHPLNFDKQREGLRIYDAKNSIYKYIYIFLYNPLNNRHRFSISIGNTKNHAATLLFFEWHTVSHNYVKISIVDW